MSVCSTTTTLPQRRRFWATQPDVCGTSVDCGAECSVSGLSLISSGGGKTIVTSDWVRGLALNILLTDGRSPDKPCGYRPGSQGGHWSESFRTDGEKIGTLVRKLPSAASVRESVALVRATLTAELQRLVTVGIAKSVTVDATYLGGNRMAATINIIAPDGTIVRVGMTGARNSNAWAWS